MKLFITNIFFYLTIICPIQSQSFQFNLKTIKSLNEDVVNIKIFNPTSEAVYILKTESASNITSRIYAKAIPAKSESIIRFKLNPQNKGRIEEDLKIYLSDRNDPVTIQLNAKVQNIPRNNLQDCPKFGGSFVFNSSTGVYERSDAGEYQTFEIKLNKPKEEVIAEQIIVDTLNKAIQLEEKSRKLNDRKTPKVNDRRSQPSLGQILFGKNDDIIENDNEEKELTEDKKPNSESKIDEAKENLLGSEYKANNIVFLLDASTSMREQDKMELLKKSMITLLAPLRPKDYLSIVTYSGEAQVLLKPTSAINKTEIQNNINAIEADGSTQAVKGIKKAIKVAKSNFIDGGNNQILLVSDGAFDIGERNMSLRNQIEKESKDGLIISTIGIKNEKWTNKSLVEISELGKGTFQRIKKDSDTTKLLEEIKQQAIAK